MEEKEKKTTKGNNKSTILISQQYIFVGIYTDKKKEKSNKTTS